MNMKSRLLILLVPISVMMACATWTISKEVPRMAQDELKAMLNNPDLTIIDVRQENDWAKSDMKIKGSVREDSDDVKSWADKYKKDKHIVLYCA